MYTVLHLLCYLKGIIFFSLTLSILRVNDIFNIRVKLYSTT